MSTLHATLIHNTVMDIIIGNKFTDGGIIIDYSCYRGSLFQSGRMKILSRGATVDSPFHSWFGDDAGISDSLAADISGDNIRLNITVDNSDVNDVAFDYNKAIIKL